MAAPPRGKAGEIPEKVEAIPETEIEATIFGPRVAQRFQRCDKVGKVERL